MRYLLVLLLATQALAGTSTTYEWSPRRPETLATTAAGIGTSPQCAEWVAPVNIVGTTLAWQVGAGMTGGKHCSVGIFSKDGTARLVTSGPQLCDAIATHVVTGLTGFGLNAGAAYQVCYCGDNSSGNIIGAQDIALPIQSMDNALSVPIRFTGSVGCTAGGDLPTSLGTFTFDPNGTRIILLIGTSTP